MFRWYNIRDSSPVMTRPPVGVWIEIHMNKYNI